MDRTDLGVGGKCLCAVLGKAGEERRQLGRQLGSGKVAIPHAFRGVVRCVHRGGCHEDGGEWGCGVGVGGRDGGERCDKGSAHACGESREREGGEQRVREGPESMREGKSLPCGRDIHNCTARLPGHASKTQPYRRQGQSRAAAATVNCGSSGPIVATRARTGRHRDRDAWVSSSAAGPILVVELASVCRAKRSAALAALIKRRVRSGRTGGTRRWFFRAPVAFLALSDQYQALKDSAIKPTRPTAPVHMRAPRDRSVRRRCGGAVLLSLHVLLCFCGRPNGCAHGGARVGEPQRARRRGAVG